MKLKFKATKQDWLIFGLFSLILLFVVSVLVNNIHSFSTHVRLHPSDNCLLNVSVLRELKYLTISSCSCRHVRSLAIRNASKLEIITIESFSFTSLHRESCLQCEDCTMIISLCPLLKEVTIEDQCFRGSKKCVISSMPLIHPFVV